jgi:hypothetical protein
MKPGDLVVIDLPRSIRIGSLAHIHGMPGLIIERDSTIPFDIQWRVFVDGSVKTLSESHFRKLDEPVQTGGEHGMIGSQRR